MSSYAPGWSEVEALLPPLAGCDVVDLGCGTGELVRWAHEQGAASVLGLDLDLDVLAEAQRRGEPPGTRFEQSDLAQVRLTFASYDLAWCADTAHLAGDQLRLARVVNAGLRPGGAFVATVPRDRAEALREAVVGARMELVHVQDLGDGAPTRTTLLLARKRPPGPWAAGAADAAYPAGQAGRPPGLA